MTRDCTDQSSERGSLTDLDHSGHGVDTAQILHNALRQVGHAQSDGPVGVTLQLDHFISTGKQKVPLPV